MNDCTFHCYSHRIRIRTEFFNRPENMVKIRDFCSKLPGVVQVLAGAGSLLLLVKLEADQQDIVAQIEKQLPEKTVAKAACKPAKLMHRKYWLRSLFTAGAATVVLAACGWHKAHAITGGTFALLATHHVWERRKALFG